MATGHALILGLGNDLLADDGFGPAVVAAARPLVGRMPGVRLETAEAAGFRLLDLLAGADDVLIVDVVQTGAHPPGTVTWWPLTGAAEGRTLGCGHGMGLTTALQFGASLGYQMPRRVFLLVAEARDLETIREGLTDEVGAAVPEAVAEIVKWAESRTAPGWSGPPRGGYADGEAV
jgi:hydrogenase maturation protease